MAHSLDTFDPDSIPDDQVQKQLFEPLREMMENNEVAPIKDWLRSGGDPNWSTNIGWTLLHFAAIRGNLSMVEFLLDMGANVDALTHEKVSPLMLACNDVYSHGRMSPSVIRALLKSGADPTRKDKNGWSALEYLNTAVYPADAVEVKQIIADAVGGATSTPDDNQAKFADASLVLSEICRQIRSDMQSRHYGEGAHREIAALEEIVRNSSDAYEMDKATIHVAEIRESLLDFMTTNKDLVSDAASGRSSLGHLVLKSAERIGVHEEAYAIINFYS